MHVCRMLWVHTNVRIGILHVGMPACFARSFVHQSVASARLSMRLTIVYLVVLSSVRPFDWFSVRPSVCLFVCMFTCTYVETNVLVYLLWKSKIELTWLISCLAWVFTGHSFHLVVVFFSFCFFVSRFKWQHCRHVHLFMQNCVYDRQKSTHIFVSDNIVLFHKSFMTVTKRVNPKPVITFYNCKICWYLKLCT